MSSIVPPTQAFGERCIRGEPRLHTDGELLLLGHARDGSLLSVEEPGILRRWDGTTGQLFEWHALSDVETQWALSQDGAVLASASDDLTLWDTTSGTVLAALTQDAWVTALAFAPDTGHIATGHDDGSVCFWDALNHRRRFEHVPALRSQISALAVSADGRWLAAASEDKLIRIWDLATAKLVGILEGHTDRIAGLAWHPGGQYLVSAGWDGNARVWDRAGLETTFIFNGHLSQVTAVAFSRDGRRLATTDSEPTVRLWDFERKRLLQALPVSAPEVRGVSFSPDGRQLACGGDRTLHVWNAGTGQVLLGRGSQPAVRPTLAVSPDGRQVVTNGGGTAVMVWDAATLEPVRALEAGGPVHDLAFSPDGRRIAGAAGESVRLWDAATGAVLADWDGPTEPITTLAFAPDGQHVATGSDTAYDVWIWRTLDGEPALLIPDALDGCAVETLAFHPESAALAVGGVDWLATSGSSGAVSLWDLPGRFESELIPEGTTALAFAPDGRRLAFTTLDGRVGVWGLAERELVADLTGHDGSVTCLAYSRDGQVVATGSDDNTVRLWDAYGAEIGMLEVESRPTGLAFAADGRHLFVVHANGTWSRIELDG